MPQLLPVANTAASSDDFTIAAGSKALLVLKAGSNGIVPPKALVLVERKDSSNVYTVVERLETENPGVIIENAGAATMTMRVTRKAGASVGVDSI